MTNTVYYYLVSCNLLSPFHLSWKLIYISFLFMLAIECCTVFRQLPRCSRLTCLCYAMQLRAARLAEVGGMAGCKYVTYSEPIMASSAAPLARS